MINRTPVRAPFGNGWAPARSPRRETPTGICHDLPPVVYFIRTDDGLIKIGHTTNLATRKRAFGSGWERILAVIPGSRDDEAAEHERFAKHLARGHEYFHPAPEVLNRINEIRQTLGVSPINA